MILESSGLRDLANLLLHNSDKFGAAFNAGAALITGVNAHGDSPRKPNGRTAVTAEQSALSARPATSMHEQRDEDDDRDRHPEEQKQKRAHGCSPG